MSRTPVAHNPGAARLFVALELPQPLRQRLAGLPPALPGLRIVAPAQRHLTLRFIGDAAPADVLCCALAEVPATPVAPALQGVGRWPGVLWAGVRPDAALGALQQNVSRALEPCGLKPETRPFRPHITLGRFPARRPPAGLDAWLRTERKLRTMPAPVSEFCLFASELTARGARYRILQRFPLRGESGA